MKYKLVCFDVDGTLVDNIEYSWQLFHNHLKVDKETREKVKKDFYEGRITYEEWAKHDVGLWKNLGATKKDFIDALKEGNVKPMKGAVETLHALKKAGLKLAIISGSLNIIMEHLFPDFKDLFDDIYFSYLHFDEDDRILSVDATEYDMKGKADALKEIAQREELQLEECVFIGDHHNDVEIAREAGLAIAFDAKDEELRKCSKIIIDSKDLKDILPYILG